MSKVRKRRANLADEPSSKSTKKYKKTPEKKSQSSGLDGKQISECDSGFPTPDSSLNDSRISKDKTVSPEKGKKASESKSKPAPNYGAVDIKLLNVSQLLNLGEGKNCETSESFVLSDSDDSSESDGDWEEVKIEEKSEVKDPVIPKEGVNITLDVPQLMSVKRKKKEFDVEAHIKRHLNHIKREFQLLIHKVHVLCWIAHLKFVNTVLNSETLMAVSLSLVTNKNLYPPKHADLGYLERIVKWFHSVIELKEFLKNPMKSEELSVQLCHEFSIKAAYNKRHFIFMLIVLFRTLGLKTRIVMSFQVVPVRPKNCELSNKSNLDEAKGSITKKGKFESKESKRVSAEGEVKIIKVENTTYSSAKDTDDSKSVKSTKKEIVPKGKTSNTKIGSKSSKTSTNKVNTSKSKLKADSIDNNDCTIKKRILKRPGSVPEGSDSDEEVISKHFRSTPRNMKNIKSAKKVKSEVNDNDSCCNSEYLKCSSSGAQQTSITETPKLKGKLRKVRTSTEGSGDKSGKVKGVKGSTRKKAVTSKSNITPEMKNKIIEKATQSSDTDSDFIPQSLKKKSNEADVDRRVFSSDDEENTIKKQGMDVWIEVFLEAEEKWISVDAVRQKIHCVHDLYSRATHPVVYVIACNNDSTLKDVTKRYVPNWHSDTRKRRIDEAWWNETMWPYLGPKTAQDREEDEDINRQLQDKPLPAVISEYKDHPLYALKRHLLKFEGIYPPEAPALGFIRGEPVYARECVVTLRSREVWFKEARVVRLGEEPYKIVKARPKYDKMSGEFKKDLPLELFGFWQTEEYIPPIATDGKVPRNEFGNVDLFKPCMLPKGTVHLQIPGLNKIARKLEIDCAAAVVGFEFHSGASHPILDGFVVCEEFKDVLLDAWNKDVDETNKRNEEKRLKRIYDNWKRLIRGLLIREKLKVKYDFGGESSSGKSGGKRNAKKTK